MKLKLYVIVGMVVGLFLAKGLAFSGEESFAWYVFWDYVMNGKMSWDKLDGIWESTTFIKSIVGVVLGGIVGFLIRTKMNAK